MIGPWSQDGWTHQTPARCASMETYVQQKLNNVIHISRSVMRSDPPIQHSYYTTVGNSTCQRNEYALNTVDNAVNHDMVHRFKAYCEQYSCSCCVSVRRQIEGASRRFWSVSPVAVGNWLGFGWITSYTLHSLTIQKQYEGIHHECPIWQNNAMGLKTTWTFAIRAHSRSD